MTVDPERLKVAMDAAEKHIYKNYNRVMYSSEGGAVASAITALDAHDRQSKAPGDAVALLAEIAKTVSTIRGDNWSPWSMANGLSRICDLATRPLVEAPEPAYDAFVSTTVDSARTEVRGQCAPSQCAYFPEPCRSVSSCMNAGKCIRQAEADYVPASPPPPDAVPFTREMRDAVKWLLLCEKAKGFRDGDKAQVRQAQRFLDAAFPPEREGDSQ